MAHVEPICSSESELFSAIYTPLEFDLETEIFSKNNFKKIRMAAVAERNQDATVYVGGLDDKVTEHLLAELFIQVS